MVGSEFKMPYKLQVAIQRKTLGILRIDLLSSQAHMNCEHYELLIASSVFETLPKETQEFLQSIMSTPATAIDTEAEELVLEMEIEVEVVTPEVTEVLAKVPKSLRTLRPKPTQPRTVQGIRSASSR